MLEQKERSADLLFATFMLDNNEYAIQVESVREALDISEKQIIKMPSKVYFIEGIVNIRGSIVPVINLRRWFGLENQKFSSECKMVITECRGRYFGILFDSISEVVRIEKSWIDKINRGIQREDSIIQEIIKIDGGNRLVQVINTDAFQIDSTDIEESSKDLGEKELEYKTHEVLSKKRIQHIVFTIDKERFGVSISNVREIIENNQHEIKNVINLEEYIRKLIVLRGEVLPVVDFRYYMAGVESPVEASTRIIILMCFDSSFGILVDSIERVVSFYEQDIMKMSSLIGSKNQRAFLGMVEYDVGKQVTLLDAEQLFQDKILSRLDDVARLHAETEVQDEKEKFRISQGKTLKQKAGEVAASHAVQEEIYITFKIDEVFAIDILSVQEIISYSDKIVSLLGVADYFQGIMNLRGRIVPIVNFRRFYGLANYKDVASTKIFIINESSRCVGVIVDELLEILKVDPENHTKIPAMLSKQLGDKVKCHIREAIEVKERNKEKRTIMIFDVKSFVDEIENRGTADGSKDKQEQVKAAIGTNQ
ncbi:MAG: chemotaxis protein CheW [Pseudomonadota bacterium]